MRTAECGQMTDAPPDGFYDRHAFDVTVHEAFFDTKPEPVQNLNGHWSFALRDPETRLLRGDLPRYSSSLDACMKIEAEIESRGLRQAYVLALTLAVQADAVSSPADVGWLLATAFPLTRCNAALKALQG